MGVKPGRATRPDGGGLSPKSPTAPRVPRQRRAFSTVGGAVDTGGDATEARALSDLWNVDPGLARALTHGFHPYAGRMHPSIARGAISRWSRPNDTVVDPFCGSGTVLVEAMGLGRRATGIDASPLGIEIALTRTTLLGEAARAELVAEARRIADEAGENARKRRRPEIPAWGSREFERYFPHVAFELFGLRELVVATPRTPVGRALRMCFSSNLVKLMRSGPEAPRDGADKRIARGVPSRLLADRAVELASSLAVLERRTPAGHAAAGNSPGGCPRFGRYRSRIGPLDRVVAAVRGHVRLRRATRRSVCLAGAAAPDVRAHAGRRAGGRGRARRRSGALETGADALVGGDGPHPRAGRHGVVGRGRWRGRGSRRGRGGDRRRGGGRRGSGTGRAGVSGAFDARPPSARNLRRPAAPGTPAAPA